MGAILRNLKCEPKTGTSLRRVRIANMKLLSLIIAVCAVLGVAYVAVGVPAQSEVVSTSQHHR